MVDTKLFRQAEVCKLETEEDTLSVFGAYKQSLSSVTRVKDRTKTDQGLHFVQTTNIMYELVVRT